MNSINQTNIHEIITLFKSNYILLILSPIKQNYLKDMVAQREILEFR